MVVWMGEEMPPSSPPVPGKKTGPEVLRVEKLFLPLTSCSTQERGPCTSPGQHSRADHHGVGVGESTLRAWKLENWPCPLLISSSSELFRAMLESALRWWGQGRASWPAAQPCNYPGPEGGLWVGPPQIPHLWSVGASKGNGPADPKMQNLHNTGQQQESQEKSQIGSSTNSVAETREASNQTNDSVINTCK